MKMRLATFTAMFVAAAAWIDPASANVTYDWVPITQTGHSGLYSLGQITFSDAAVAGGAYQFSEKCSSGFCTVFAGDPTQIAIRSTLPGELNDLTFLDVSINVSFVGGDLLSGAVFFTSAYTDFTVSGSLGNWSGSMNSDALNCATGLQSRCLVTGFWQDAPANFAAVPEPGPLALLFGGLLGLAAGVGSPRIRRGFASGPALAGVDRHTPIKEKFT